MKTLKLKLNLDFLEELKLNTLSNEHRLVYNHLLDKSRSTLSLSELNQFSKHYRVENDLTINAKSTQNTTIKLVDSIKGFFSKKKKDKTAKIPYKFKSWKYFFTFKMDANRTPRGTLGGGFTIDSGNLSINLLNKHKLLLRVKEGLLDLFGVNSSTIKTITIYKKYDEYFLSIVYDSNSIIEKNLDKNNFASLDLGFSNLYALVSNCIEPYSLINDRFEKLQRRIEFIQSKLDKKIKYSKSWKSLQTKFRKLKQLMSNKLQDFQHKSSKSLIKKCVEAKIGTLIIGNLKVKEVIKKKNRSLKSESKNCGLSRFKEFIAYKAINRGLDVQFVNEAWTSKMNCWTEDFFYGLQLKDRVVELIDGLKIDRDLNAAINIAKKIKGKWLTQIEDLRSLILNFHKIYMKPDSTELLCV